MTGCEQKIENLLHIDQMAPEILKALSKAPIYKKVGFVNACPARLGEKVVTVLEDGHKEVVNTAQKGDWIVENPSGERYLLSPQKFVFRYSRTSKKGVFEARGFCRAIRNPFKRPISITMSRGSLQTGDEKCMIADTCNEKGEMQYSLYLIDIDSFKETYKLYHQFHRIKI